MEQYTGSGDGKSKPYRTTKEAHATLFQKRFQPLYLEHLSFLINRAGGKSQNYIYTTRLSKNVSKQTSY